jgi:Zn-dependent protease with chaperone function
MRRTSFAVQVLGLLVGFYVMCLALIAALVTLTVLAFEYLGVNRFSFLLLLVTVAGIYIVLRGLFASARIKAKNVVGIAVRPTEQPALWQHVRQLAAKVGTRAPSRIYLMPDVNAMVWENSKLLGLIPGKRQMGIGLPLLMALTPAQMDAVLAHELGHYGNRDTQLGALTGRARASVMSAMNAAVTSGRKFSLPGARAFFELFRLYAVVVLKFTQSASRAQELAADRVAAQIAGPANAIAALERLHGIDVAFDFYLARYVSPGLAIGLRPQPPDLFGGFLWLLADASRQAEIEELRKKPQTRKTDPFDSHPPMPERLAALAALPDASLPPQDSTVSAFSIIADPGNVLAAVANRSLKKDAAGNRPASWDGLAQLTGLHRSDQRAKPLVDAVARLAGRKADLGAFVALVDAGRLNELLAALPASKAAQQTKATGRVAREHAKTELARMLTGWLEGDLARTGRASWAHSWADIEGDLRMPPELKADLEAAVAGLTSVRPDGTRLRAFVSGIGVAA